MHKMQGEALCHMFITLLTLVNVFFCGRQAALTVAKEFVCEVYFTLLFLGILGFLLEGLK